MTRKLAADPLMRALDRVESVLARIEALLPAPPPAPDWTARGVPVAQARDARFPAGGAAPAGDSPRGSGCHRRPEARHRRQHPPVHRGLPANNVLLTGSRGTGKSSLVKACWSGTPAKGLRLIEVDKSDLVDLPDIVERIDGRPERFIVFCDDLSFDANEPGYKALKVMLDGSIAAPSVNVLIYATSNRRHLLPEYFSENLETRHVGRRSPSRRIGRGEDLAVRALRAVDFVLSVQPGRLSWRRRAVAALAQGAVAT